MIEIIDKLISCNYEKMTNKVNKFIAIHYTTDRNGNALNSVNWFNNPSAQASAQYVVDAHYIYRTVLDKYKAWHCGTKGEYFNDCRNSNSIGIEIASRHPDKTSKTIDAKDPGWSFDPQAVENAAELTATLMKQYNIPIENVVMHYDVTHKWCPAPFLNVEDAWSDFKNKVMVYYKALNKNDKPSTWAEDAWNRATKQGLIDGTRPHDPATREELVVILDRLGLVNKE